MSKNKNLPMYVYNIKWPNPSFLGTTDIPSALFECLDKKYQGTQQAMEYMKQTLLIGDYELKKGPTICGIFYIVQDSFVLDHDFIKMGKNIHKNVIEKKSFKSAVTSAMVFCIGEREMVLMSILNSKPTAKLSYYLSQVCNLPKGSSVELKPKINEVHNLKLSTIQKIILTHPNAAIDNQSRKVASKIIDDENVLKQVGQFLFNQDISFKMEKKVLERYIKDYGDLDVSLSKLFEMVDDPHLLAVKFKDKKETKTIRGNQLIVSKKTQNITTENKNIQPVRNLFAEVYDYWSEITNYEAQNNMDP